jgi:hypothetical protein
MIYGNLKYQGDTPLDYQYLLYQYTARKNQMCIISLNFSQKIFKRMGMENSSKFLNIKDHLSSNDRLALYSLKR